MSDKTAPLEDVHSQPFYQDQPFYTPYGPRPFTPGQHPLALQREGDIDHPTQSQFADECDINTILSTYKNTGLVDSNPSAPKFGDFTNATSFHDAMNLVLDAQDMFDDLPSNIRERFNNDPEQLLRFVDDPRNTDEAISLGLANPPATPRPQEAGGFAGEVSPSPATPTREEQLTALRAQISSLNGGETGA